MARGTAVVPDTPVRWFARLGAPLDPEEAWLAHEYAAAIGLPSVAVVETWREAERVIRDPVSGEGWWIREEDERRSLMRATAGRVGEALLLETLGAAVEGQTAATFEHAAGAGGDEALARVASGAALMALHNRTLALLAGCGRDHVFMQKYALFAAGRWPLGRRGTTLAFF